MAIWSIFLNATLRAAVHLGQDYEANLRHAKKRMLDFGQFDFGQFDFGQLAEIELAEIEIGRSRNWPKSKLIGRSRTDSVCSVSSFFFFLCFVFTFLYFFLVLTHLSLHFVSVLFLFSSPKT